MITKDQLLEMLHNGRGDDDQLEHLMGPQLELQMYYYGMHPEELPNELRIKFIQDMVTAAQCELVEILDEVGWKPWASSKHINVELGQGEVIDLLHFVFNLALGFGMTPAMVYDKYLEKQAANRLRATGRYNGIDEKCHRCGRDVGDVARAVGKPTMLELEGNDTKWVCGACSVTS